KGALRALARLQHARKEAAISHSRNAELECPHSGIPTPITVAVAFTLSVGRPLVALRTQMLSDLELHQCLAHHAHALAQRVDIRLSVSLAQQFGECHAHGVGHRLVLLFGCSNTSDENHRWPFRSRAASETPHVPGL